ncbi:protease B nonderepressible form [Microbotryomycetes sp. JL201]|nr:protease B nonderepressible form [Microbotryomycetes sp. JL201]
MSFSSSLGQDGGLHPTLHVHINPGKGPRCPLYLMLSAPPSFIIDRFQLAQLHQDGRLGFSYSYERNHRSNDLPTLSTRGYLDLEQPVIRAGSSSLLLRVAKNSTALEDSIELDIPLHLRYQRPSLDAASSLKAVELPGPRVFWLCSQNDRELDHACPPDVALKSHLSGCGEFTALYLQPLDRSGVVFCDNPPVPYPHLLQVPTGVLADLPLVEKVNTGVVWAMAVLIALVLLRRRPQAHVDR